MCCTSIIVERIRAVALVEDELPRAQRGRVCLLGVHYYSSVLGAGKTKASTVDGQRSHQHPRPHQKPCVQPKMLVDHTPTKLGILFTGDHS